MGRQHLRPVLVFPPRFGELKDVMATCFGFDQGGFFPLSRWPFLGLIPIIDVDDWHPRYEIAAIQYAKSLRRCDVVPTLTFRTKFPERHHPNPLPVPELGHHTDGQPKISGGSSRSDRCWWQYRTCESIQHADFQSAIAPFRLLRLRPARASGKLSACSTPLRERGRTCSNFTRRNAKTLLQRQHRLS